MIARALTCVRLNLTVLVFVTIAGLFGCDRAETRVYDAPKEKPAAPAPGDAAAAPGGAATKMEVGGIRFNVPAGWTKIENPPGADPIFARSRLVGFDIATADGKAQVTVTKIPGGGTQLDNINRWRMQLGLQPVEQVNAADVAKVKLGGQEADLLTVKGEQKSMLAAYQIRSGNMVTFKLTGDSKAVDAQKAAFADFLQSVEFAQ